MSQQLRLENQPRDSAAPGSAPAWLTIDLAAIGANYKLLQDTVAPGCQVAGFLKADAYGLGMQQIFTALEAQNCPYYYVATPDEALQLRALTRKPVAILEGLFQEALEEYIRHDLTPVLNTLAEIELWQMAARDRGTALPCVIHFDTGMNRLGLDTRETEVLLAEPERLNGLRPEIIMSHLACADEPDHEMTVRQFEIFRRIAAHFPQARKSLCNSFGVFAAPSWHMDQVRPGMALYGLNPVPGKDNPMAPVIKLEARILQVRSAGKGETVGYGATHKVEKDTQLATIALGYGDGFMRSLSNKGRLYYKGEACPVAGRVSMDMTTVDVGHLTQKPRPGEAMEIIGPHQSADALAADAGTIGYEILTELGKRYYRIYKG